MRPEDTFEGRAMQQEQEWLDSLPIPPATADMRSALIGMDEELRKLYGAPHRVDDHGLAHAWVVVRQALYGRPRPVPAIPEEDIPTFQEAK